MAEPKLRFPEFKGEWKVLKLSDIADRINRKNSNNETDLPLTISSLDGLVDQRTYFNKVVASKDMSGYYLLKNGEFAYNKSYSVGYNYGSIKRLDMFDMGALSTLYICFSLKDAEQSDFMVKYFDSQKWYKGVYEICAEGARNHGLLNVPVDDFLNMEVCLPKDKKEEEKILELFGSIDDTISAIESEVALWEEKKNGAMQKIFSQEVRFRKEDGSQYPDWQSGVFKDVFEILKNNTLSRAELNYERGYIQNIHYGDVLIKYPSVLDMKKEVIPYITDKDIAKKMERMSLKNGDVIISDTAEDETVGKATEIVNLHDGIVVSGLHTIPIRPVSIQFALGYLGYFINSNSYHDQLKPLMQGIKVTSISKSSIQDTIISYPCIEEQQKIVDCLLAIDETIQLKKQKLETWKNIKKGLLQQMFV